MEGILPRFKRGGGLLTKEKKEKWKKKKRRQILFTYNNKNDGLRSIYTTKKKIK